MMTPGVACDVITSHAPTPKIPTCTAWRTVRVIAAMATVFAAVGRCSALTFAFCARQRAISASVMPSVCATSALASDVSR